MNRLLRAVVTGWNAYWDTVVFMELLRESEYSPERTVWPGPNCRCHVCVKNRAQKLDHDTLLRPAAGLDPKISGLLIPVEVIR